MKTDSATMKMKAKLDAFFATATEHDISALLQRTNYDFYKNIDEPPGLCDDLDDLCFDLTESDHVRQTAINVSHLSYIGRMSNRPIVHISRSQGNLQLGDIPAADHQDLALAA